MSKRIMFYYSSMALGGAERVIAALANNFSARGDEVYVMVLDAQPSAYRLDARIKFINLGVAGSSKNKLDAMRNNMRRLDATRKQLSRIRPDVVICFGINLLTFVLLAKPLLGIKTVGSERSNPFLSEQGHIWQIVKKIVSPWADGFIFQTRGASEFYPPSVRRKSTIIPNGIFVDSIPDEVPPLPLRPDFKICAAGRLHPVKGFDLLIQAFALFHPLHPQYRLHIYGEGEQRPSLEKLISRLNLSESVVLEGRVSNLPNQFCQGKMFILSSLHEGMPNVLIEALACGLPCAAVRCDFGPAELIEDGKNGLLVPVADVKALATAMARIADDSELACKLAQNALNIRETNSINSICARFYDYIISIADSRKPKRS